MACQESSNKVGDVINKELLEILNCQLNRLQLVESDKIGATRLVPKVEEVPRVYHLRPITLLIKMPTTRYACLTAINI